jgi:outer membrane translocation and assembly module TamA
MEYMPALEQQFRLGVVANYVHLRDNLVHVVDADNYDFIAHAYINYHINNEDSPTYASRGWKLNVNGKYIMPVIEIEDGTRMRNSFVVRCDFDGAIAMGEKNSLKLGATLGTSIGENELPLSYQFFLGGQSHMKYFDNIISFDGLKFTQLYGNHIAIGKISWQSNFYKNIYGIINFNGGYVANNYDIWFADDSFVLGCGLTLGMKTMAGPVEISLTASNRCSGLVGFFNVGYWF